MKKSGLIVCIMVLAAMASCGKQPGKVSFNNAIDTASYSLGMARTQGFIEYLVGQMDVDTAYMDDFAKGFYEGAKMENDEAKHILQDFRLVNKRWIRLFRYLLANCLVIQLI